MASSLSICSSPKNWLIDSDHINHKTCDWELFQELDKIVVSKVKIENGSYITAKPKREWGKKIHKRLKLIFDVLYVPKINLNHLCVGYLEKGYKVFFDEDN